MFRTTKKHTSWSGRDSRASFIKRCYTPYLDGDSTIVLPIVVPYANSLDPDEMLGVSSGSKLFDTQAIFSPNLKQFEMCSKRDFKQTTFSRQDTVKIILPFKTVESSKQLGIWAINIKYKYAAFWRITRTTKPHTFEHKKTLKYAFERKI